MDDNETRVTVRVEKSKVNELDDAIIQAKARGDLDRDTTRSDLLRECIDDLIEDLEGNPSRAATVTAD